MHGEHRGNRTPAAEATFLRRWMRILEPSPSARKDTCSAAFFVRMSLVLTQCSQHSARSRLPDVGVLSTQANFAADPEAAQAVLTAGFRSVILGNLGESRLLSLS